MSVEALTLRTTVPVQRPWVSGDMFVLSSTGAPYRVLLAARPRDGEQEILVVPWVPVDASAN